MGSQGLQLHTVLFIYIYILYIYIYIYIHIYIYIYIYIYNIYFVCLFCFVLWAAVPRLCLHAVGLAYKYPTAAF